MSKPTHDKILNAMKRYYNRTCHAIEETALGYLYKPIEYHTNFAMVLLNDDDTLYVPTIDLRSGIEVRVVDFDKHNTDLNLEFILNSGSKKEIIRYLKDELIDDETTKESVAKVVEAARYPLQIAF